jgi:hypothetical protein
MLIVSILLAFVWLTVAVMVLAICRTAARADSDLAGATESAGPAGWADLAGAAGLAEALQSPRRPTTWGTVRRRIFTSPHNDQFAT